MSINMSKKKISVWMLIVIAGVFSGCATIKTDLSVMGDFPKAVSISPKNADGIQDTVNIPLTFPQQKGGEITGYSLSIVNEAGTNVYAEVGTKQDNTSIVLPTKLFWAGKDMKGNWAPDGAYSLSFEVKDAQGNTGKIPPIKVMVDNTPPAVSVKLSPLPFTPDNNGENDTLNIAVSVSDSNGVKDWNAAIKDPTGQPFIALKKDQFKNDVFIWDGKSGSGELVQSAMDYVLAIEAVDTLGNKTIKQETIPIDILVIRDGDRLKINIASIYFKPFTADFMSVDPSLVAKNMATLDKLAVILKKYNTYDIRLEGHAVRVNWKDPKKGAIEEKDVLLPLSKQRADAIRDALVKRGVKKERMSTVGLGSSKPIVPHSDATNNWKNRRVEFILIKK